MKKLLLVLPLFAVAAIGSDTPRHHQVVIAWAQQTGFYITDSNGTRYQYAGAQIFCSSSSAGAPHYPQQGEGTNLVDIAEAAAELSSQGYTLQFGDNGLTLIAIKK